MKLQVGCSRPPKTRWRARLSSAQLTAWRTSGLSNGFVVWFMKNQYVFGGFGSSRKRSLYLASTCGRRSPVGSSVMKSSLPLMTSWVIFGTVSLSTVILLILPGSMPGTLKVAAFVSMYSRLGLTIWILYGPAPGMELDFLKGDFAAGVGAELARPTANRNWLSASVDLTVISPVLSFSVMPEMSALGFLAAWYLSMPSIPAMVNAKGPPRKVRRLMLCSKSLALTGVPSEYLSPFRSVNL